MLLSVVLLSRLYVHSTAVLVIPADGGKTLCSLSTVGILLNTKALQKKIFPNWNPI